MTTETLTGLSKQPLFSLKNRVALLTGAAGHLGQVMAEGLCQAGAHVILNGRTPEKINALADRLTGKGYLATACVFDMEDEPGLLEAVEQMGREFGQIDVLVNNAYHGVAAQVESDTVENFNSAYHLTVSMPFRLIQAALPYLEKAAKKNSGGASVINMGSMYGMVSPDPSIYGDSGQNNPPHYGAAKAGLIQLTRYLACHLAPKKIRVNALSPGPFPQPSVAKTNPPFHQALCDKNPMGRIGISEELIGPLVFLASDAASYVTGINLPVDGGWTSW